MIRTYRGLDGLCPVELRYFDGDEFGGDGRTFGAAPGYVTAPLPVQGLVLFQLFYVIAGAGNHTIQLMALDHEGAQFPNRLTLATGQASGSYSPTFGQGTTLFVCQQIALVFIAASGTKTITAARLFGRSHP